jgi:hypothetical protein
MKVNCVARKSGLRVQLLTLLTVAAIALPVFADSKSKVSGTFYGPPQAVATGTARSYFTVQDGVPVEIGFELSEAALSTVPAGEKWQPGHEHKTTEYLLPLPSEAESSIIKVLELDWNPGGHEPPGVYDVPHFDFHFYTISLAERNAIDPADPDYMKKAEQALPAEVLPAGCVTGTPIMAVPRMGVHWAYRDAEELNGKPFTKTFIHGSWQGRMIFYEPMIAKAFLESKPDVTVPIAEAKCYQPAGHHPTTYTIRYDNKSRTYRVSLGGFTYRGCESQTKTASNAEHNQ